MNELHGLINGASCPVVSAEEEEEEEEGDEEAEKAFLQFYINVPAGPPLSQVLRDPEKRRKLGEFFTACGI